MSLRPSPRAAAALRVLGIGLAAIVIASVSAARAAQIPPDTRERVQAERGSLMPPPGYRAALGSASSPSSGPSSGKSSGKSGDCEPPPAPFTATLDFPSKYEGSGKARDQLNPEADAEYKRQTAPINRFEKGTVALLRRVQHGGRAEDIRCLVSWYTAWADAGALLAPAADHTGRSVRKWTLASVASAWLPLKFSTSAPLAAYPKESRRIEAWLSSVADKVVVEWPADDPVAKLNNHYYWAAWALMATSVATDRRDLFDDSLKLFRVFETQVDADGTLPNELRRATRAASYTNYAMMPLAMIAAFAKANGVDLANEGNHALIRFAKQAGNALAEPASFAAKAGAEQETKGLDSPGDRAWLEAWCWTVRCTSSEQALLAASRPALNTRLGGDLTVLFASGDSSSAANPADHHP